MKLVLATRNPGKIREFEALLPGIGLVPWPPEAPELPEEGAFFADNALQKVEGARAWWALHGPEPVAGFLADDSGLCVEALWGGPGVLSARFAPSLPPADKNAMLLRRLPPGASRTARFVCVLAFAPVEGEAWTVDGTVEGRLAETPRGSGGFGYDPIFIPEGHEQTFGELPAEVKQHLSHRARAARRLHAQLVPSP